ncbi:Neurogenic locus Notch protein-like 2, partial [Homarus americanus]
KGLILGRGSVGQLYLFLLVAPEPTEAPGCTTNDECGPSEVCRNRLCLDPCVVVNPCAPSAECQVINRSTDCSCPPGYTGNPYVNCYLTAPRPPRKCEIDIDCFKIDSCLDSRCQNPCFVANPCPDSAVCKPYKHQPYCLCPDNTTGDPWVGCVPEPKEEPECRVDPDCETDKACVKEVCVDPCLEEDPCGRDAFCRTQQHRPTCYCLDGWAGNPQIQCFKPECTKDEECLTNKACINQNCVDPCTYSGPACGLQAQCRPILHHAQCFCPPGTQGDPTVACVIVGCRSNDDCSDDKACDHLNRVCVPVCEETTCAVKAQCHAANHAAMCVCPPPFTGNPYLQCYQLQEPPVIEPECRSDSDCPSQQGCINDHCKNPCAVNSPCLPTQECRVVDNVPRRTILCECPPDHIFVQDGVCVKPEPECRVDSDCNTDEACRQGTCTNVCRGERCGLNALCSGRNHRHQCRCFEGYEGDPLVHCKRVPVVEPPTPDCTTDDDCSDSESCYNQRCINPCFNGDPCSRNAFCYTRNHSPVCRCPDGYVGDPQVECRPSTVPGPVGVPPNLTVGGDGQACSTHQDCGPNQWCQGGKCALPCPTSCPTSAQCQVNQQRPVCSCPPSTTGDPHVSCSTIGCVTDSDCPYTEKCYNGNCRNPCHADRPCAPTAQCTPENHSAVCTCSPGYTGEPTTSCLAIGCSSSDECPSDKACYRGSCVDPCLLERACGPGSSCTPQHHTTSCVCRPGLLGDPYTGCSPPPTPQCRSDFDCAEELGCVDGECKDLCTYMKPCGVKAECRVIDLDHLRTVVCECPPGHTGSAYDECLVIDEKESGCQYEADCPLFHACVNKQCRDPCEGEPCAENAVCRAVNHRPICYCPSGYTGDGHNACSQLECRTDTDCEDSSVCHNYRCVDACTLSRPCGAKAECHASQHTTQCRCEVGYHGDPYATCTTIGCRTDSSCPTTHGCVNGICVDRCTVDNPCDASQVCNAQDHQVNCSCASGFTRERGTCVPKIGCSSDENCSPETACVDGTCQDLCKVSPCGHQANCTVQKNYALATVFCQCGPGLTGDPFTLCVSLPPSGCSSQYDCLWDQTCVDGRCVDPCRDTLCAPGATCRALGHRGVCSCAAGYQGDPQVLCTAVGCTQRSDCPVEEACVNGRCVNPCKFSDLCGAGAECQPTETGPSCSCPEGFMGDPYSICRPAECSEDSQCPAHQACQDQQCQDPCEQLQCVTNAQCRVENHQAKCHCLVGYIGTPDRYCSPPPTAECEKDQDCPGLQGCVDEECQDLCEAVHPCGTNAICKVLDNQPMKAMTCSCPENYEGDPHYACTPSKPKGKVDCSSDLDCPLVLSCVSGECRSPCPGGCGLSATCSVLDHRPVCHCQPGYAGDPHTSCFKIDCESDAECPPSEMCQHNTCIDPCRKNNPCPSSAICVGTNHLAQCQCPPGMSGNPQVSCQLVECMADQDCKSFEACVNGECKDPCIYYNPCAKAATCQVANHKYECACPPGLHGDPRFSCEEPKDPSSCLVDQDCPPTHGCILKSLVTRYQSQISAVYIRLDDSDSGSTCRDLCQEHKPCGPNSICSVIDSKPLRSMSCACPSGYHGDAKVECREIPSQGGCTRHTDCLFSEACVEGICRDPCNCGLNAQCHVSQHRPFCTCAPGHTGDPHTTCYTVGCVSNIDCPGDKACVEQQCVDPCTENSVCAPSAMCTVEQHQAKCSCHPGERGDPTLQCLALGCRNNDECPPSHACINEQCQDPCKDDVCGVGATCHIHNRNLTCSCPEGYKGDPRVACRPQSHACVADYDCGVGLVCVRGVCTDPCKQEKPCAPNAKCTVQETRPIKSVTCTCPADFTGDAKVQCRKITPPPEAPCLSDNECPDSLACLDGQCVDPCSCGENTVCRVVNHHAICSCAPGYGGDPYNSCFYKGCSSDDSCPPTHKCHNGYCVDPCHINNPCAINAECFSVDRETRCRCPPGLEGDPHIKCETLTCLQDNDCPRDRTCRDGQCVDPCIYTTCASSATCTPTDHRGECQCPPGYQGDPTFKCVPDTKPSCTRDKECREGLGCISGRCQELCGTDLCGVNAVCHVVESAPFRTMVCECLPGHHGDAHTQCRPKKLGCVRDTDCALGLACVEGVCRDPCDCGVNALCTVVKHRPICTCAPGYEGNPQIACS